MRCCHGIQLATASSSISLYTLRTFRQRPRSRRLRFVLPQDRRHRCSTCKPLQAQPSSRPLLRDSWASVPHRPLHGSRLVENGTNTFITRILTAPAAGITVSNGDGVSGNLTLALANDLAALEGLGSTGIAVRTAADTWAQRTITGSAQITVADGNGVAGNPTLSITADSIGDSQLTFNTGQNLTTLSSPTFAGLTLSSPLGVVSGGTGVSSLSGLLQGNGTSAITAVTGTAGQFPYYNGTNTLAATSSIFLATSGNVGIGTTTPSANLDVYSASSFGWLSVTTGTSGSFNAAQVAINRGDTANGYATINFYSNLEGVEDWQMGTRAGDSKLHFLSGGADTRMVIDNVNGYVGIGASD